MSQDDVDSVNPLSDKGGNFFENIANAWVNSTVKVVTGGDMSYKDGKLQGKPFHALDESFGEVTGRNVARKALMENEDAVAEEKLAKRQQIVQEQTRAQQQDVASSTQAASYRATAASARKSILGTSADASKDFLGL